MRCNFKSLRQINDLKAFAVGKTSVTEPKDLFSLRPGVDILTGGYSSLVRFI